MDTNCNCQYATPGTYGHECGAPATSVLVTKRLESTRRALINMGATPSADGLARSFRCDRHRNVREYNGGDIVRSEPLAR